MSTATKYPPSRLVGIRAYARALRKVDPERVREWHAAGWTDKAMAAACRASHQSVGKVRLDLGLSPNRSGKHHGGETLRRYYAQRRQVAARYGLPTDWTPLATAVAVTLAAGPRTRAELSTLLGVGCKRAGKLSRILGRLVTAGYLARIIHGIPGKKHGGTKPNLYVLTDKTMQLLLGATA